MNDKCEMLNTSDAIIEGDTIRFGWQLWLGSLVCWLFNFLAASNGVKSISKVVWITVPLPIVLMLFMLLRGLQLPGADIGIRMMLSGTSFEGTDDWTWQEKLSDRTIWTDATAQVFFTLSICSGVMTTYGSYRH